MDAYTQQLIAKLKYQGNQYSNGQSARGGSGAKHFLTQSAEMLESLEQENAKLREELEAAKYDLGVYKSSLHIESLQRITAEQRAEAAEAELVKLREELEVIKGKQEPVATIAWLIEHNSLPYDNTFHTAWFSLNGRLSANGFTFSLDANNAVKFKTKQDAEHTIQICDFISGCHATEHVFYTHPQRRLTEEDLRKAGAIVHSDGDIFCTNIEGINRAIEAKILGE